MLRLLLVLLLTAPALHAQPLPPGATAADSMLARLGADLDRDERAYFGFFPDLRDSFRSARVERTNGGELLFTIDVGGRTDERRVRGSSAEAVARYVARFEALRAPGASEADAQLLRAAELSGLVRHPLAPFSGDVLAVRTRDGRTVRGWLLYADAAHVALWPADLPFDIWSLSEHALVVDGSNVATTGGVPPAFAHALPAVEAAAGLVVQGLLAAASYATETDASAVGFGVATAGVAAAGMVGTQGGRALLRRGQRRVDGDAQALKRLGERAYLSAPAPPRLRRLLDDSGAAPVYAAAPRTPRAGGRLHLRLAAPFRPAPSGGALRETEVVINARPSGVDFLQQPTIAGGRAGAEAVVDVAFLHVGGAYYRTPDAPEQELLVASGRARGTQGMRQYERLTHEAEWAAFAGVTLGERLIRLRDVRVEVGGGVAHRGAQVDGAFAASLGASQTPPLDAANTIARYTASQSGIVPYGRLAVDYFATPVTSVGLVVSLAPQPDLVVPAQSAAFEQQITSRRRDVYAVTQQPTTYTFSPLTVALGLRTHLF